jgi:hypothetical protein
VLEKTSGFKAHALEKWRCILADCTALSISHRLTCSIDQLQRVSQGKANGIAVWVLVLLDQRHQVYHWIFARRRALKVGCPFFVVMWSHCSSTDNPTIQKSAT